MAKDYAKKTRKRNSASRFTKQKQKKSIPAWIWLIAGLLIGVFATALIILSITTTETVQVKKETEIKTPSAKSRYQAVPAEESQENDFSYHEELRTKTVEVPEEETGTSKATDSTRRFIMQCGSFKKQASAETLKAQIAMNGFTANIKATKEKSGTVWYRVSLGPYSSKRDAERERHQLERNNINNCRIW